MVAFLDDVTQNGSVFVRESPWLFVQSGVLGGMGTENRTEEAELHPASIQFQIYVVSLVMASDVMTPVTVEHI